MRKKEKHERRYYVNGRWYSPELSTPLCIHKDMFDRTTLYHSPKGAFFTVRESTIDETANDESPKVKVLSKTAARAFMDEHPGGIYAENYNRVFGEPAQG